MDGHSDAGCSAHKQINLRANSVPLTGAIIIADAVGAGILSFSTGFAYFGWLLGSILTLILIFMNMHICLLMWRVYMKFPESHTYMDMAAGALGRMPSDERRNWVEIVGVFQYSYTFGLLGLHVLSVGKGFGMIFYQLHVCLPTWTIIGSAAIIPFYMTSRTLGTWKSLMYFNVLTIICVVAVPLVVMYQLGVQNTRPQGATFEAVTEFSASNWVNGVNTMTFAVTSQYMLIEVIAEMKDCSKFPQAYMIYSMPFQIALFLVVGCAGYYYKGSSMTGMIVDNIPFDAVYQCASCCLVAHMLVSYVLKATLLGRAAHAKLSGSEVDDDTSHAWSTWTGIVLVITGTTCISSNAVPFFEDFVNLLGACMCPAVCYIIPILLYWRTMHDHCSDEEQPSLIERIIIVIEMIFSILSIIVGTYCASQSIYNHWHDYGPPFDCHCQDIWKTCDCSHTHAGMEHCLQFQPDFL